MLFGGISREGRERKPMRSASVFFEDKLAGLFTEVNNKEYLFQYDPGYDGPSIYP